jgi:flavin-dependent dehydrogenase
VWGAGSHATGVTSPIGAPKLELLSQQIAKAANRMGVSPEQARDMILTGKAHAGFVDPMLLGGLALGAGGAAAAAPVIQALRAKKQEEEVETQ